MKAVVYDGKETSIKEVSKPNITDTQVLVDVKAAGICGTDLAIIKGHMPTPTPIILGHEIVGTVIEVGNEVNPTWKGKRVAIEINSNIDKTCYYCQRELFTQCVNRKAIGIDIDGGFADFIAVESYLLHEIPEALSFEEGTFIEPLAAAYQTFEMMPLDSDDKIMAIFGLGKLGLLILQVAKQKGLKIIAIDGSEKKLQLARQFGAEYVINRLKEDDIPKKIRELSQGIGADIVLDASGSPGVLKDVIASCRTCGKIHIKSTHGLETPMNITEMVVRELTVYTSRCGPFEKAIEGLKNKNITVKELISKSYPLLEIKEAIESYEISRDHIKTILII